ncbi:peroxidase manganese-dependent 1 [Thozetella sp. PMI_491]|nr:peroxidase manganese-dependent 1 [Thozetella sp. PMI_491]
MKSCTINTVIAVFGGVASAYPGMARMLKDMGRLHDRQQGGFPGSTQLLGDLVSLPDSSLTKVGADLKAILQGGGQPLGDTSTYNAPGELGSQACNNDPCCVYKWIVNTMQPLFYDRVSNQCTPLARGAVRLGFHDAGTWSVDSGYGNGGADGSILLTEELNAPEHAGLDTVGRQTAQWYQTFRQFGVGMADLIQLGALTATVTCPSGPRIRFFVGRKDNATPGRLDLLPSPTGSADSIVEIFRAKSFSPGGLAALIGAHTVSTQSFQNPAQAGAPQDSTPGTWDNLYYNQTIQANPPGNVYKFPSDVALAQHDGTAASMQFFGSQAGGTVWQSAFAAEYIRMSVLGVYNLNEMTECTKVLPLSTFQG